MELRKGLIILDGVFVGPKIERVEYRELTPATEKREEESFKDLANAIEKITGVSDFLSLEELQENEKLRPVYRAIGSVVSLSGLPFRLWGVAPPPGKSWGDIVKKIVEVEEKMKSGEKEEVGEEESFSLWVAIVGDQIPRSKVQEKGEATEAPKTVPEAPVEKEEEIAKARRGRREESVTVLSAQLVTFKPARTEAGETIWIGSFNPPAAYSVWTTHSFLSLEGGRKKKEELTPEEAEKLREEFVSETPESEEEAEEVEIVPLGALEEEEIREERKREKVEDIEAWESLAEHLREHPFSRNLLKEVLLKKLDELLTGILRKDRKWATGFFFRKSQEGRGR